MPPVYIEYMPGTIDEETAHKLLVALRQDAMTRFSGEGITLDSTNIGIYFVELSPWSDPTDEIVVRIHLHDFPERAAKRDEDAAEIADLVAEVCSGLRVEEDISIGVSLLYANIGWATARVKRNSFPEGDR